MPITCSITPRSISKDEFVRLDYEVMRIAFDVQNELGRLCDEQIYRNDLADRLHAAGIGAIRTEVPISVSFRHFAKIYRADILVNDAALYELKAVAALLAEHQSQTLNYLYLFDLEHGKLVNFRSAKVESEFINNPIRKEKRHSIEMEITRWRDFDARSFELRQTITELVNDWGAFLECPLYVEALVALTGGEEQIARSVPMFRSGVSIGNQRMYLLNEKVGFKVTALPRNAENYEFHLRSLLRHTNLSALHWINFARHQVQLVTIFP